MEATTENAIRNVVLRWKPTADIQAVSGITPDASLRRYFRVHLRGEPATVVAMVFDSVASPEVGGAQSVRADDAYVELTEFLAAYQVKVPALYYDARDAAILLIEDCGDIHLIDTLGVRDRTRFAEVEIEDIYRQALRQIVALQRVPQRPEFFPFQRAFTATQYYNEMLELREFTLSPRGLTSSDARVYEDCCAFLADELDRMPRVLVHRDFHSWNLLVAPGNAIRIIDFQDALMATRCYDLVGLIHDRDTDAALGESLYARLLEFFKAELGDPEWFAFEFHRTSLQRDLKVAGRFAKLSALRGLVQYEQWIPGTQRRIGRTLQQLSGPYQQLGQVLGRYLPDVAEGKGQ